MGNQGFAAVKARYRYAAAVIVAGLLPLSVEAACPGAGCPAIRMDIGGLDECPGAGCPAFDGVIREQQDYINLFGGLQSGSDDARPLEERLLLTLGFDDQDRAVVDLAPVLQGTCSLLIEVGAYQLEVLGLSAVPGPQDARRAQSLADDLREACVEPCSTSAGHCPQITTRNADARDALPGDLGLSPNQTLIELRLLP